MIAVNQTSWKSRQIRLELKYGEWDEKRVAGLSGKQHSFKAGPLAFEEEEFAIDSLC